MKKDKPKKPKLDSDDIESIAIRKIEEYFEKSTSVKTFLNRNDKSPFFDGYIFLYQKNKKVNENFIGSINVQSKGKTVAVLSKEEISYPIRSVDLKAYKKGGTLYFVTQITENERKLFYRELTPSLISNILRAHSNTEKPSVKLFAVPDDITLMEQKLSIFKRDCELQTPAAAMNSKPYSIQEIKDKGINTFNFAVPGKRVQEIGLPEYVSRNAVYLYAELDPEHHTFVQVGDGPVTMSLNKVVNAEVSVGDKVYYESYQAEINKDYYVLRIGEFLSISFPRDNDSNNSSVNHNIQMQYNSRCVMLKDAIKEAEFIMDMCKHQSITLGEQTLQIKQRKKIELFEDVLPQWRELDQTVAKIGLNTDVKIEGLSKKDCQKLDFLVEMIGNGAKKNLGNVQTGTFVLNVSNVCLLLWLYVDDESMCTVSNFFDETHLMYKFNDEQILPASVFSSLTVEQWIKVDNINYEKQLDSYKQVKKENPYIYGMANMDCLRMMQALDEMDCNNPKYHLTVRNVFCILQWIEQTDEENVIPCKLNRLQLKKRIGKISIEDEDVAREIMYDAKLEPINRAEAAVILDEEQVCLKEIDYMNEEMIAIFCEDSISRWFTDDIRTALSKKRN